MRREADSSLPCHPPPPPLSHSSESCVLPLPYLLPNPLVLPPHGLPPLPTLSSPGNHCSSSWAWLSFPPTPDLPWGELWLFWLHLSDQTQARSRSSGLASPLPHPTHFRPLPDLSKSVPQTSLPTLSGCTKSTGTAGPTPSPRRHGGCGSASCSPGGAPGPLYPAHLCRAILLRVELQPPL